MKRIVLALVLTMVAFAATSSFAQSGLRFDVPFGFSVEGRHYVAGAYELCNISNGTAQLRQLRNIKTGDSGVINVGSPKAPISGSGAQGSLKFVMDGEYGYLASLTDLGGTTWKVPVAKSHWVASRGSKQITIVALK